MGKHGGTCSGHTEVEENNKNQLFSPSCQEIAKRNATTLQVSQGLDVCRTLDQMEHPIKSTPLFESSDVSWEIRAVYSTSCTYTPLGLANAGLKENNYVPSVPAERCMSRI